MGMENLNPQRNLDPKFNICRQQINEATEEKVVIKYHKETLKPRAIVREVRSLFEQYAEHINSDGPPAFCTPELSCYDTGMDKDQKKGKFFISHVQSAEKMDQFAIMDSQSNNSLFLSLPYFSFIRKQSDYIIRDEQNQPLCEDDKLVDARILVERLKHGYQKRVEKQANQIRLKNYGLTGNYVSDAAAYMVFDFFGANEYVDYQPIEVSILGSTLDENDNQVASFVTPAEALHGAIDHFYEVYGEEPTPDNQSPLKLKRVALSNDSNMRPINRYDMQFFNPLLRAKTTYDSDIDLIQRLHQEECNKALLN